MSRAEEREGPAEPVAKRLSGAADRVRRALPKAGRHPTTWSLRRELGIEGHGVHTHTKAGASGPGRGPKESEVDSAELLSELQMELRKERSEVLEPLLHRLSELGERLRAGVAIPPEVVEEGLGLLDRYIAQLHDVHIGQFAEVGVDPGHADLCFLPMAQMEGEPERGERRVAAVRALLSGYRAHQKGYDRFLGLELRNESIAELSWEGYAEDYARTCVPSHLSPTAARKWRTAMGRAAEEFLALRSAVGGYLSRSATYGIPHSPATGPAQGRPLEGTLSP